MHLPEQKLFSMKDVAARWGKSISYVQDLTRSGKLPMGRGFLDNLHTKQRSKLRLRFRITRQDLEKFEREHVNAPAIRRELSIKEYMVKHEPISEKSVRRYIRDKKLDARKIHGRWMIFE